MASFFVTAVQHVNRVKHTDEYQRKSTVNKVVSVFRGSYEEYKFRMLLQKLFRLRDQDSERAYILRARIQSMIENTAEANKDHYRKLLSKVVARLSLPIIKYLQGRLAAQADHELSVPGAEHQLKICNRLVSLYTELDPQNSFIKIGSKLRRHLDEGQQFVNERRGFLKEYIVAANSKRVSAEQKKENVTRVKTFTEKLAESAKKIAAFFNPKTMPFKKTREPFIPDYLAKITSFRSDLTTITNAALELYAKIVAREEKSLLLKDNEQRLSVSEQNTLYTEELLRYFDTLETSKLQKLYSFFNGNVFDKLSKTTSYYIDNGDNTLYFQTTVANKNLTDKEQGALQAEIGKTVGQLELRLIKIKGALKATLEQRRIACPEVPHWEVQPIQKEADVSPSHREFFNSFITQVMNRQHPHWQQFLAPEEVRAPAEEKAVAPRALEIDRSQALHLVQG